MQALADPLTVTHRKVTALELLRESFVQPARGVTAGLGVDKHMRQLVGQEAPRGGVEATQAAERKANLAIARKNRSGCHQSICPATEHQSQRQFHQSHAKTAG